MFINRYASHALKAIALFALVAVAPVFAQKHQAPTPAAPGELTVDRIYGQPSLSGRLTRGIVWAPDGKRFGYLQTSGAGKDAHTELWVMDAATGERKLLVPADKLETILPAPPSKDNQATGAGRRPPAQYVWSPKGDAILFVGPNALAVYDLAAQSGRVLVSGKDELSDVKYSPDGKHVSFLRDHNIWLVNVADGKERALTAGGTEAVRKGELDWVYPEELDAHTAYVWAPDSSAIAFMEMDESKVSQFPMVDFDSPAGEADMQRYPVAGGNNPVVRVLVVPAAGGEPRVMDIGKEMDMYIPRIEWLPDSKHVAIQRLNRAQTELDLLVADAAIGKSAPLSSQKDAYWINVADDLHFFQDGKRFLWSNESTGYRHLYLFDMTGKQLAQLTKGDWEVSGVESVDEKNGVVYFSATEKSPLERHLYKVNLDGSGFSRITKENGSHHISFAPGSGSYIDTYSNTAAPPRQDLYKSDGTKTAAINENKVDELASFHLSPVEFSTVKTHDGVTLNASIIKPPNFDPRKKYPVIVYTYGGPHAQVVVDAWTGSTGLWHQLMAQKGYVIFSVDNRGSAGRGHLFEEPIHFRFGAQELSDQRDGVAWLKAQPWVDPQRIGIWGWSYGGHMTLHAMFEDPEDFKVGFAGGPVTDWHYYDSIYTERYIGNPQKDSQSYLESSPVKNAERFKGKLLIAHGTGDDNVHFSNTLAVVDELIKAGKYVEVMPFPGRGHGVSDAPARRVLMNHVTLFFLNNL